MMHWRLTVLILCVALCAPPTTFSQPVRETLLEQTFDACSHNTLIVRGLKGDVTIEYGRRGESLVPEGGNIIWFCGGSQERTGCPRNTNYVKIQRSQERRFSVLCYRRE